MYQIELEMQNEELRKSQTELQTSQEKYYELYNFAPTGYFTLDENELIKDVNFAGTALLGVEKSNIISTAFIRFIAPDSRKNFFEHIKLLKDNKTNQKFELKLLKNKKPFPVILEINYGHYNSGGFKSLLITAVDITEMKLVEEDLRHSNEWISFAQHSAKSGFWNWDMITGQLKWSEELYGLFGLSVTEEASFDTWLELIHPDDRQPAMDNINSAIKEQKFLENEYRIIPPDGREIWISSLGSTSYDVGGKPKRMSGICLDITERKKTEGALMEIQREKSEILDILNEAQEIAKIGSWDWNLENNEVWWSDETYHIFGATSDYIPNFQANRELIHPDDLEAYQEKFEHSLKTGQALDLDVRIVTKTGEIKHCYAPGNVIYNKSGKAIRFIGNIMDITKRKKADLKVKKSLTEKENLLREIHHRVKNNMQIISSLLNLQIQHVDEEQAVNVLKESQGRVKSMAMVHEKLYQSPNFTNINFKEYVERLVLDIFYSYGIKTGSIESVLDIEDINIGIETAIPLGLIINELVTNSVKYAFPQGEGTITINLESLQDEMELIIADDGIGISKNLDIKNTNTLGLQLVNSLVNQIEGNIKLDRSNGTEFKIAFKELEYKERL